MEEPQTKAELVRGYILAGDYKRALGVVYRFRRDFCKRDMAILQMAHDILAGNEKFYIQIGKDINKILTDSEKILNAKYLYVKS